MRISARALLARIGSVLVGGLALIGAGPQALGADVPDVTNPAVVAAFVDGAVKPIMEQHHSPSGVVAVMKNGQMIFAKGYGYIDVEKRTPVDPATSMFRPGSISKLFTWVSVMQLVEQGKLDLDTDVNQYSKEVKVKDTHPGKPVTLRHIMTHTAGFEDGGLGYLIIDNPKRIMPLAKALAKYQPERINPPGEHVAYSNWATALAGLIVQDVSGVPFNDYVQKNIFDVLGMTHSTFVEPLPPELDAHMAKAYGYAAGKYTPKNYEIISNFGPAGASAVSASDMAQFALALLNDGATPDGKRILKPETLQKMVDGGFAHDPRVRGMGLGFIKRDFGPEGFDNFGHDGGTTIFLSHFGLSKKENFMLFSSFSGPGGTQVYSAFNKAFYDEFFPREAPTVAPPADFAKRGKKYDGQYHSYRNNFTRIEAVLRPLGGVTVKAMDDNTLLVGDKRYVEVDKNLFREIDGPGRIAFQEDKDGKITNYVLDGMGVMQFFRAPWYDSKGFLGWMVALALLVFIGVLIRLAYQWSRYRASPAPEKSAWNASIAVAVSSLLFFILAALAASKGQQALMYELPTVLKVSLIFPLIALIAGLYHLWKTVQVWRTPLLAGLWPRVRYTVVCFFALFMIWFYFHWNLIGFRYLA